MLVPAASAAMMGGARAVAPLTSMSNDTIFEIHPGIVLKGQLSMAKDIVLTGKFEGDLQTLGCLTVAAGGVVIGSIEAGALVLEPGNLVEARVKVDAPTQKKIFEEARKVVVSSKWPGRLQKLKELALGRK
jgi:cytoskeletal protein CcmA (bactofilin family)